MVLTTFVAALLPFFGDFIALTGSLSVLPLDFVLVLAMTLKVGSCLFSTSYDIIASSSNLIIINVQTLHQVLI